MVLNVFRFNEFDHKFFSISNSEVEQMDPQQKQLLQCVYRALENAGIPMEKASGTRTGVFFGKSVKNYFSNTNGFMLTKLNTFCWIKYLQFDFPSGFCYCS